MTAPGPAWLRRAGRLDRGGGESLLWSVAEGRRGRRWRSVRRNPAGVLVSDLLLEVDPEGRWTRLELATARGILVLHPDLGVTATDAVVAPAAPPGGLPGPSWPLEDAPAP